MNIGFFAGGTQSSSDGRLKDPTRPFNQAEMNAAKRLAEKIGFWTWIDDEEKRLHAGMTVQTVLEILNDEGLDWRRYGFIGYDKWDDVFEPVIRELPDGSKEDSGEIKIVREAGDLWQFRDQELDRFIMRGLSQRLSELESKLS